MAVTTIMSRAGAKIDVEAVPAAVTLQLVSGNLTADPTVVADPTSADIYPRHVAIHGYRHMANLKTNALAVAIGQVGIIGQIVANNGIQCYAQNFTKGSGPTAGSTHRKFTIADGLHIARRISCDHQDDCEMDTEVIATFDGTNAPIVEADSIALPTAPTDAERFTIGSFTLENVEITQITNVVLEWGIEEVVAGSDSDIYATMAVVRKARFKLTITSSDPTNISAAKIPRTGLPITHANTVCYFRKRSTTASGFVADGTAEHIAFTMAGMAVARELFVDNDNEPAGCTIEVTGTYDATNTPVVFDTASAIA